MDEWEMNDGMNKLKNNDIMNKWMNKWITSMNEWPSEYLNHHNYIIERMSEWMNEGKNE